jgi:hypothetical protein
MPNFEMKLSINTQFLETKNKLSIQEVGASID